MLSSTYIYLTLLSIISIQSAHNLINLAIISDNALFIVSAQLSFYLGFLTMVFSLYGLSKSVEKGYYNYSNNRKELIGLFIVWYLVCILMNSGLIIYSIKKMLV